MSVLGKGLDQGYVIAPLEINRYRKKATKTHFSSGALGVVQSFFHITKVAVLIVFATSCLGDPVGPGALTVAAIGGSADTAWVGAPGEPIAGGVRLRIADDAGHSVPGASLTWEAVGANSLVLNSADQSNRDGYATAT